MSVAHPRLKLWRKNVQFVIHAKECVSFCMECLSKSLIMVGMF